MDGTSIGPDFPPPKGGLSSCSIKKRYCSPSFPLQSLQHPYRLFRCQIWKKCKFLQTFQLPRAVQTVQRSASAIAIHHRTVYYSVALLGTLPNWRPGTVKVGDRAWPGRVLVGYVHFDLHIEGLENIYTNQHLVHCSMRSSEKGSHFLMNPILLVASSE